MATLSTMGCMLKAESLGGLKLSVSSPLKPRVLSPGRSSAAKAKSKLASISCAWESESLVESGKKNLLHWSINSLLLSLATTLSLHSVVTPPAFADEETVTESERMRKEYAGIIRNLSSKQPDEVVVIEAAVIEVAPPVVDEPAAPAEPTEPEVAPASEPEPEPEPEAAAEVTKEVELVVVVEQPIAEEPEVVEAPSESVAPAAVEEEPSTVATSDFGVLGVVAAGLVALPILVFVTSSNPEKL